MIINSQNLEQIRPILEQFGYKQLKIIDGRGLCGIKTFAFTTAIVYGLDATGYLGRYCYPFDKIQDLVLAYEIWDGKSDPLGGWIKHKGYLEYKNPQIDDNEIA